MGASFLLSSYQNLFIYHISADNQAIINLIRNIKNKVTRRGSKEDYRVSPF